MLLVIIKGGERLGMDFILEKLGETCIAIVFILSMINMYAMLADKMLGG